MTKHRQSLFITLVAVLLVVTLSAEVFLIFNISTDQTKESGMTNVESANSELESLVSDSCNETLRLAVEVQPYISDNAALKRFVITEGNSLNKSSSGACTSVFVGTPDEYIAQGSEPDAIDVSNRNWYTGAVRADGDAYVTPLFEDTDTGDVCYTVSVLLGDGETVIAANYNMTYFQQKIDEEGSVGGKNVMMITNDGLIAAATNREFIGETLAYVVPEYSGVFSLVKTSSGAVNITQKRNDIFAVRSVYGWTLIVSERTISLYKSSFVQLIAMSLAMFIVFGFIIVMTIRGVRESKKARDELEYRDRFLRKSVTELKEPLAKILNSSSADNVSQIDDYEQEFNNIRAASDTLSQQIKEILAYSELIKTEKPEDISEKTAAFGNTRRFRFVIVLALSSVIVLCSYINIFAATNYGESRMDRDAALYGAQLSEWIEAQKSTLNMFCSIFSTQPELLDDHEKTKKLLTDITAQYPDISLTCIATPNMEYKLTTSGGDEPDGKNRVEEREWYTRALDLNGDIFISAPYYDSITGNYCVTFSKAVCDADTGEQLGVFAIDFYMDKLVNILGGTYSDNSYAFLTDGNGRILNHPYGAYQMSGDSSVNVLQTTYSAAIPNSGKVRFFPDYDGTYKAVIATYDEESQFSVYVVNNVWYVYRGVLLYSLISTAVLIVCVVLVYRLISSLINLQERANKKLRESADAAIAADEAKSSFLAQMSHEIRTPINAVIGMNEMILRESSDNTIREYAVNIQSAGRTLLSLINSILDFSKIEDGKMEIIPVKYDTASMIHDLVTSITPRAKSKGLELIVRTDATLPSALKGDDVRIKQCVSNLLTNAVKYTESGSVTLVFKRENQHDDTIDLYVEVTDTGIGIKEEDLGKLFDSFRRLEEKRNRNIEGTGLGMSIVTKLLAMMDTKLEVKSEYGKGSTFCFRVKQRIASPVAMGDYTSRIMKAECEDEDERHIFAPRAKVLVVDDNEMNIKVAVSMIKMYGIVPDTAGSGFEAIERAKEKNYHVIFMDHMMPKMDGIETLAAMNEEELLPDSTYVIALTANAIVGAKEMYLSAGFDDYLSKPIESRRFERLLEKYLPESIVSHRKIERPEIKSRSEEPVSEDMFTLSQIQKLHGICPELDIMTGLSYCMDSKEFYLDTLQGYLDADKSRELCEAFKAQDTENYGIHAHSLKSTSKTIGALVLSEHAKELEFAAKRGDTEYIKEHHETVMQEYGAVLKGVGEVLKNEQGTGN